MYAGCQYYPFSGVEAPEIPAYIQVLMARAIHPRAGRARSNPFGIGSHKMSIWYRPSRCHIRIRQLVRHRCSLTTRTTSDFDSVTFSCLRWKRGGGLHVSTQVQMLRAAALTYIFQERWRRNSRRVQGWNYLSAYMTFKFRCPCLD